MRLWILSLVCIGLLSLTLEEISVDGIPFTGVTPNLTTGWFHKSGPTESLLFGLIVLKVMALRMAGVFPYNLNNLLAEGNFLDNQLKSWRRKKSTKRSQRDLEALFKGSEVTTLEESGEFQILERVLLGLRRIDSHDCFLEHLCNMSQRRLAGRSTASEEQILRIFRIKNKQGKSSVLNLYASALHPEPTDCSAKFKLCPLEDQDFTMASILNGLF